MVLCLKDKFLNIEKPATKGAVYFAYVLVFPFLSFRLPLLISRWVTFARSAGHWCFSPPSVMLTQEVSSFSVNFLREMRRGYLSSTNLVLFPWRKTCFYLFICPQVLIKGTTIHHAWSLYAQASVAFMCIFSLQGFAFYTMLSEQSLSYGMIVPYPCRRHYFIYINQIFYRS